LTTISIEPDDDDAEKSGVRNQWLENPEYLRLDTGDGKDQAEEADRLPIIQKAEL